MSFIKKEMAKTEAIIQSMTPKERAKPSIIDPKRKRRIAAGSGTTVPEVNKLLKQFEQMQKMMKKMPGMFGGKRGRRGGFGGFGGMGKVPF